METTLSAVQREEIGKQKVNKLRNNGQIPGVLYGEGKPAEHICVSDSELCRLLLKSGKGRLISLNIKKGKKDEKEHVLIKEYQRHPVKGNILHIDFLRVDMSRPVSIKVSIQLINEEKRMKDGAIIEIVTHEVEVSCLPANIPDRIMIDVSKLAIGTGIHIKDLVLPEGVRAIGSPEEAIVLAATPTVGTEPTAAEANAAETPAVAGKKEA